MCSSPVLGEVQSLLPEWPKCDSGNGGSPITEAPVVARTYAKAPRLGSFLLHPKIEHGLSMSQAASWRRESGSTGTIGFCVWLPLVIISDF